MRLREETGNEISVERWLVKKKMMDGAHQHTYLEYDSRLREFVQIQSNKWCMPEKELEGKTIDFFVRAVNYFENDDSVTVFIRNED